VAVKWVGSGLGVLVACVGVAHRNRRTNRRRTNHRTRRRSALVTKSSLLREGGKCGAVGGQWWAVAGKWVGQRARRVVACFGVAHRALGSADARPRSHHRRKCMDSSASERTTAAWRHRSLAPCVAQRAPHSPIMRLWRAACPTATAEARQCAGVRPWAKCWRRKPCSDGTVEAAVGDVVCAAQPGVSCGVCQKCRDTRSEATKCSGRVEYCEVQRSRPRVGRWGGHEVLCPLPATQHGASCGVQVCEGVWSRGVAGDGCDGSSTRYGRRLRCSRISVVRCEAGRGHGHGQRTRERRSTLGGGWRLSYFVLFTHPEANPEATAVYSRSGARARHPPCFSWRSAIGAVKRDGGKSRGCPVPRQMRRCETLWDSPPKL
jgi:hypothetical protein